MFRYNYIHVYALKITHRIVQCQFNVTGWGIMFICGMVLRCANIKKKRLKFGPVTADLTITVVHSSKLLLNDVKPDHSLTESCFLLSSYGVLDLSKDGMHSISPFHFVLCSTDKYSLHH